MEGSDAAAAAAATSFALVFFLFWLVLMIAMVVIFIIPIWRILGRLGYTPAWSLITLVPFGSIIGLYVVAFSTWPIDKHLPKKTPTVS